MPADPDRIRLLNPGPVTLSAGVRAAMLRPDLCHRQPEFADLMARVRRGLVEVYPAAAQEFAAVLLTGSGTAAVEAMAASLIQRETRPMVIRNGVYGERIAHILATHGHEPLVLGDDWLAPLPLEQIDAALAADKRIRQVLVVHHETTTGRLNDLNALADVCLAHGARMLVDTVSSFGGEAIDFDRWPLDAVSATANKCLHGVPGIAFVIARRRLLETPNPSCASVYLNLQNNYAAQEKTAPLFTPAVQALQALDAALDELKQLGGWAARHNHYATLARRLRSGLADLGLQPLLDDPAAYGSILTSVKLPDSLSFDLLFDRLYEQRFVIYPGQRSLFAKIFRIANMGDLTLADIDEFIPALAAVLDQTKSPSQS